MRKYKLELGWNAWLFDSAKEAASALEAMERGTPVDTLYAGHDALYYVPQRQTTITVVDVPIVYPERASAELVVEARNMEAEERRLAACNKLADDNA